MFLISKYVNADDINSWLTAKNVRVPTKGLVIFLRNLNMVLGPSVRSGILAVL